MRRAVLLISLFIILTSFSNSTKISKTFVDTTTKTILLKKHQHMFFIEIKVNGKQGNLLVDTGAAFTIFDINQAKYYGFKYNLVDENLKFVGLNGQSDRYHLANYKIHHDDNALLIHAYGADLSTLTTSFSNNGLEILGIIGSDYFTSSKAIIDYKNHQLIIQN